MAAKGKKLSLTSNDTMDITECKPKDLIWAKMKGFTPWPAMICDPPLDLLNQPRKTNSKCVFFFGTRNFAWIEINNIKPYEGPWKADLAKVAKPSSFRQAMADIEAYIEDPTEVDEEVSKNTATNHSTEADFDKIRDGIDADEDDSELVQNTTNDEEEEEIEEAEAAASASNGIEEQEEEEVNAETAVTPQKTPVKKSTGKAKTTNSAKAAKGAVTPASGSAVKSATKRVRSQTNSVQQKRKRTSSPSGLDNLNEYVNAKIGTSSSKRKINTEALANVGASSSRRTVNSIALLDRPVITRPETQPVDMNVRSQILEEREITPSNLTFGFLGLGVMGSTIVKDLICTGHKVVVWNRTMSKCTPFAEAGAEVKDTPMDVVEVADIIFCCVSDPKASKDLVFGNCGVLQLKDLCNKAYVEMSTIDPETSQDIAEGITHANGRYLEVQIHGSRREAEDGMLIILAGGDRTVFDECNSCFKTIAKNTFFLGAEVGNACKVNLILQTIAGVSLVGLAEALALADRFSISLKDIMDIFELTSMKSEMLVSKGKEMTKGEFNPQQPLSHMQKDLRLALSMAEHLDQSMPVTAITSEVFKHTKRLGYSDHDSSAVFVRSRF